jgi:hypothetical protein
MTACPVCGNDPCVYNLAVDWDRGDRYVVNGVRVSKKEYVQAERAAGFSNELGHQDEPATSSFDSPDRFLKGHIEQPPMPTPDPDDVSQKDRTTRP